MKLKSLFHFVLILNIFFACNANAQNEGKISKRIHNYENLWKEVDRFEEQSLPKSAIEQVDKILKQALADKNGSQVIKCLLIKNRYKMEIDSDCATAIFVDIENLISKTTDIPEKALLYSILAELYLNYYQADSWNISKRTKILGYVPQDIQEWTRSIFYDKAIENFNLSIKEQKVLEQVKVKEYKDIIILGNDTALYYPSLYDFLLLRAIEHSQTISTNESLEQTVNKKNIKIAALAVSAKDFVQLSFQIIPQDYKIMPLEYYRLLLGSLVNRNLKEGILITELSKNTYLQQINSYKEKYALDELLLLEKQWQDKGITIEIIDNIIRLLESHKGNKLIPLLYSEEQQENEKRITEIYNRLQKGIQQYPNYKRIAILKSKLNYLEQPSAVINGQRTFYPTKEKTFDLIYKNINQLVLKIYKIESALYTNNYQRDRSAEKKTLVKTVKVDLKPKTSYLEEKIKISIPINEIGNYKIEVTADKKQLEDSVTEFYFSVSQIVCFSRASAVNEIEFFVTDRVTGKPLKEATISIYSVDFKSDKPKYILLQEIQTNASGFAIYKKGNENNSVIVYGVAYKNNVSDLLSNLPYNYQFSSENNTTASIEKISIFTDRSIYRPGQIVYFKAIVANKLGKEDYKLITSKEYKVTLYDVNRQVVAEQRIKTNEFGSLSGEFMLPQGSLNGNFSIQINNSSDYFKVEEYKRPTFEITFDKLEKTYKFGEAITLIGKAVGFSGIKLQKETVNYTIAKRQLLWQWMDSTFEFYDSGSVITKEDGTFEITFIPEKNKDKSNLPLVYTFKVTATVTDSNGETQTGDYSINVGNVSMLLNITVPERLEKTSDEKVVIKASNLDGQELVTQGTYSLYTLTAKDSINNNVVTAEFKSGTAFILKDINKLVSGKYRIKVAAKDSHGNIVEKEQDFVLYSEKDKNPPIKTNEWIIQKRTTFDESKNAEVVLGVSDKEVHILYEIIKGGKVFERKQITLSNENRTFILPYKAAYEEGVYMIFTYIKDEKIYKPRIQIKKEEQKKELHLKFNVFRDKLRPGQNEEWIIAVQDHKGKPANAELLASMYDISLDKIYKSRNWLLNLSNKIDTDFPNSFSEDNSFENIYQNLYFNNNSLEIIPLSFDKLNWFGFNFYGQASYYKGNLSDGIVMTDFDPAPHVAERGKRMQKSMRSEMAMNLYSGTASVVSENEIADTIENTTPVIRSNFKETAFFYPQLRTNEKGETLIAFTIPESNTTWKFRALAYDKTLNTGMLEAQIVSRKELMVIPNMPRFVRQGDRTNIAAKIANLSEKTLSGKVHIEFFNPIDDCIVTGIIIENQIQDFQINKGTSTAVNWTFLVPNNMDLLGCRIIAENETFGDGEQQLLPILPNRILVTESMPIDSNGKQMKEFRMEKLLNNTSPTISNYRLTLEFSSNPAWYAIQALPVLITPDNEDAISWFASYYANTLAPFITKAYPKVNNRIAAWIKQGGTKETLSSKLEQNEELKNVLLQETPWVLEAKEETQQMKRLSLLFDLNRSKEQTNTAITKLKQLQNPDGGWSWFKEMKSSRSITQYILYGFSRLIDLNAVEYPESVKVMQMKALSFIDKQLNEDFESLKKYTKNWEKITAISTSQLEYLYVRSNYRAIPMSQETMKAEHFYTAVVEKNWTKLGLYERSLLAVIAKRNGDNELVKSILISLREHATQNEILGMFWANNRSQTFISQSIVTVHTFIMEAFREAGATVAEMDMMKQWLLKQKQTQIWESTHATIDAIYALLSTGTDWMGSNGQAKISVNNKIVEASTKDLGMGYLKEVWTKTEIIPNMGVVKVEKTTSQPAWGALYWQYFQDIDKVSLQKGSLNVEKKLFVEKITSAGKTLVVVTADNPLKIGDKMVVRITVRNDRDIEFVQLKDSRASCFESIETLSGTKWQNGVLYYQTIKEASTNLYFDTLPKGTYVFEYPVYVTRSGEYSNGITTVQCLYAPELVSHTEGIRVIVKEE